MSGPSNKQDFHPCQDKVTFTITQRVHEVEENIPYTVMSLIVQSKPDSVVRLFDTNKTSYASWTNHVVTSDVVRAKNWKSQIGRIRDQGQHETCWAIVGAELISSLRYIFKYDVNYTNYSAQYLVDFVDMAKGRKRFRETTKHYCFRHRIAKGLKFVKDAGGIPLESHWQYIGCRSAGPPNYKPPEFPHVQIESVVEISSVHEALPYLEFHPIGASLAVFRPDYYIIKEGTYRGPLYQESKYEGYHAVSIYGVSEENGETVAFIKSSHGEKVGNKGYLRVSLDVVMIEVPRNGDTADKTFTEPRRLLSRFCFPKLAP
ncbi:unnamed protein product [Arabidopsis halleri]